MGILDGKVALVTGAGQGLGRGVCEALAEEGAAIVAASRTLSKVESLVDELTRDGARAHAVECDVGERAEVDACVAEAVDRFGTVDVLVNAAHHNVRQGKLLDMSDDDIEAQWRTGPLAVLRFMRACHSHLSGGGAIVNIGSAAQVDPGGYGPYGAAKEAIRTLSRAAASEWGRDGIRVNVVVPFSESPSMEAALPNAATDAALLRRIPLRRVGDPRRDVGRVVVFLAGPDSSYVTGQLIAADGGMAHFR